jgi:hypothetical protein
MTYTQQLNQQAEWCVAMAKQTASFDLFRKYLDLADAYRRRAQDIERGTTSDWTPIAPTDPRLVFGLHHDVGALRF